MVITYIYGGVGDGGPTTSAQLNRPPALAIDERGNLFTANPRNNWIHKVALADTGTRPTIMGPRDGSQFSIDSPTPVTFAWTTVTGAAQYGFEHTGPGRQFSRPNATLADPVNGFGGAGGGWVVPGTSFSTTLPPSALPGTYQVRVIGLSATGQPVGTFSDALTVVLTGEGSGLDGLVLVGPTCPVVRIGQDCPDRPLATTLVVQDRDGRRDLFTIRSGDDGRFRVALSPGEYRLVPASSGLPYPRGGPQQVTVEPGRYTPVTVLYDSGIR